MKAKFTDFPLSSIPLDHSIENDSSTVTWSEDSYSIGSSSPTDSSTSQTPTKEKSSKNGCSFMQKCLLFNSFAFLAIIIVIIIVIGFTILKSAPHSDKISTSKPNSYHNTKTAKKPPIITQVGTGGANDDPPCQSYTSINDPLRNIGTSGIGGACDNGLLFNTSIGGRWIRFEGAGGTKMPQTSPGMNHCGAYLAGWFNSSLPMTNGTRVDGYVCLSNSIFECIAPDRSAVINCGDFYVYFLRPVSVCNARYCTT